MEIHEQVGDDNIFLFGLTAPEVEELWKKGYNPVEYYNGNLELRRVIDMLTSGVLGSRFDEIAKSLLTNSYGAADAYMTLADFDSYVRKQEEVGRTYLDKRKFFNMSLVNIAKAGLFSADRAVTEYADDIWQVKGIK